MKKTIIIKETCPNCGEETEQIVHPEPFGYAGMCRKCKQKLGGTRIIEQDK